jgi:uncharacterized cupin superfamily protein
MMTSGPKNIADLNHRELQSSKTGEKFSLSAALSDSFGFKDVFIHHEIIPPGRRSSSPHAHTHREEMIFVLEGAPVAHVGSESYQLKPGDYLGFPPGRENTHVVENPTSEPVKLLVIASNPAEDEVLYS